MSSCKLKRAVLLLSSALCSAQPPSSSFIPGTPADEAVIRAIIAPQSADKGDSRVAADLDWENAFGIRYTNLKKRNDWLNVNIKSQFKDATNETLEVNIRFLGPSVAVGDEYWHVAGQVYDGDTKPGADRWGRTTYIFKKENGTRVEVMERVADLRAPYFKHYDTLPAAAPVDQATLASYAGKYMAGERQLAEISVSGDHLAVLRKDQRFVAIPMSSTEFLSFNPEDLASYLKMTFAHAGSGPGVTLTLSRPSGEVLASASRVP
jgi:hypothetical protein